MKRLLSGITGLFILISGLYSADIDDTSELGVSVSPDFLFLDGFGGKLSVTYSFENKSMEKIKLTSRSAVFTSSDGAWTSAKIGPIANKISIQPGKTYLFKDTIHIPDALVFELYQTDHLKSGQFEFVQSFDYICGDKKGTVSVKWDVGMASIPEKEGYSLTNSGFFYMVLYNALFEGKSAQANLAKFLMFADSAYGEMVKTFGYSPLNGEKIGLRSLFSDNYPNCDYYGVYSPYISIPANMIAYPNNNIYTVFTEKLASLFIIAEFPNPPQWMISGADTFFACKVCQNTGYIQQAQAAITKMSNLSEQYISMGKTYLFNDNWDMENPGGYPAGAGRVFLLMGDIEALCGSDIFPRLFAQWKKDGFQFPKDMNSLEKTALVIDSLAKVSGKDVLSLFVKYGYQPVK